MKRTLISITLSLSILLLAGCQLAFVGLFGGIVVAGNEARNAGKKQLTQEELQAAWKKREREDLKERGYPYSE